MNSLPQENTQAPDFTLPDSNNTSITLKDFLGKNIVIFCYPKDNTPGCTKESIEFSQYKEKFESHDTIIWGVSKDSIKSHCSFIQKKNLTVTLLADTTGEMLKLYGVLQMKKLFGKEYLGIVRTTFLINKKGIINTIWSPVSVKGHVEEVLKKSIELNNG